MFDTVIEEGLPPGIDALPPGPVLAALPAAVDVTGCGLDHRIPDARGGPTHEHNLAPCCHDHHHRVRHHGWTYRRLPNRDHQWASSLGHTYPTRSPPSRSM